FDVDELPDLMRLAELLQADSSLAPATATYLATIKEHLPGEVNRAGASRAGADDRAGARGSMAGASPAPTMRQISLQSPYIVGAGLAPALSSAPSIPPAPALLPTTPSISPAPALSSAPSIPPAPALLPTAPSIPPAP